MILVIISKILFSIFFSFLEYREQLYLLKITVHFFIKQKVILVENKINKNLKFIPTNF